jgi:hypothetical protein
MPSSNLAEEELAVTEARGGRGVADEVPPPASGSSGHELQHVVGAVDPVRDDLHRHPPIRECSPCQAGGAGS